MKLSDLLSAIVEIFPRLSIDERHQLLATIDQLKAEAAAREADQIKDPEIRAWHHALHGVRPATPEQKAIDISHEQ